MSRQQCYLDDGTEPISFLRVAAIELMMTKDNIVIDQQTRTPFPLIKFSHFKHGDRIEAQKFGLFVADKMMHEAPEHVLSQSPPRFLVPFKSVPTASYFLSLYCVDEINAVRSERGLSPGDVVQIYKNDVIEKEYAALSHEGRSAALADINFDIDPALVRDRCAVVLDDVRITGTTERAVAAFVLAQRPRSLAMAYLASFDPAQALANPALEAALNRSREWALADTAALVAADRFNLGVRVMRAMLRCDPHELAPALRRFPEDLLLAVLQGAASTGPRFCEQYRTGLDVFRTEAAARRGAALGAAGASRAAAAAASFASALPGRGPGDLATLGEGGGAAAAAAARAAASTC